VGKWTTAKPDEVVLQNRISEALRTFPDVFGGGEDRFCDGRPALLDRERDGDGDPNHRLGGRDKEEENSGKGG
jgi:hypothetical protein